MKTVISFIAHAQGKYYHYSFREEIIQIEDMDDDGLIEYMIDIFDVILDKDNEEVLRKLEPKPSGIGRPTNHEEFQKGVYFAKRVYYNFLSLFINQKVEDGFASSLGFLTEYEKGISYHDEIPEYLINLYVQEPTEEAPNGPVAAYDLLVQYSEDLILEGKQFQKYLGNSQPMCWLTRVEMKQKRNDPVRNIRTRERVGKENFLFGTKVWTSRYWHWFGKVGQKSVTKTKFLRTGHTQIVIGLILLSLVSL